MDELNTYLHDWHTERREKEKGTVHRSILKGRQLKGSINHFLRPPSQSRLSLSQPDGTMTSDTKEIAQIFADTLKNLGGDPQYNPPQELVDRMLTHAPQCSVDTPAQPLLDMTWEEFQSIVYGADPKKTGGSDRTNSYLVSILPPNLQRLVFLVVNKFLREDLPDHWTRAEVCLIYKKKDPHQGGKLPAHSTTQHCIQLTN